MATPSFAPKAITMRELENIAFADHTGQASAQILLIQNRLGPVVVSPLSLAEARWFGIRQSLSDRPSGNMSQRHGT